MQSEESINQYVSIAFSLGFWVWRGDSLGTVTQTCPIVGDPEGVGMGPRLAMRKWCGDPRDHDPIPCAAYTMTAVRVLLIDAEDNVLFVRHRPPRNSSSAEPVWRLPGRSVRVGDPMIHAAHRCLVEEVGVCVDNVKGPTPTLPYMAHRPFGERIDTVSPDSLGLRVASRNMPFLVMMEEKPFRKTEAGLASLITTWAWRLESSVKPALTPTRDDGIEDAAWIPLAEALAPHEAAQHTFFPEWTLICAAAQKIGVLRDLDAMDELEPSLPEQGYASVGPMHAQRTDVELGVVVYGNASRNRLQRSRPFAGGALARLHEGTTNTWWTSSVKVGAAVVGVAAAIVLVTVACARAKR